MYVGVSQGKQNNVAALETRASIGLIECLLGIVNTFSLGKGNIRGRGEKKKLSKVQSVHLLGCKEHRHKRCQCLCTVLFILIKSYFIRSIIQHLICSPNTRVYISKNSLY